MRWLLLLGLLLAGPADAAYSPDAEGIDIRSKGCNVNAANNLACMTAARDAAIAAGVPVLIPQVPAGQPFKISATMDFKNAAVVGLAPISPGYPAFGAEIQCPVAIAAPCVSFGVDGVNVAPMVRDLIVSFTYAGTPVAGDVGMKFLGYNGQCHNVLVYHAYDGIQFGNGAGPGPQQVDVKCDFLHTYDIKRYHTVMASVAAVFVSNCRLGANGVTETGKAFIGMTGNDPNTIVFDKCMFNPGAGSVDYVIDAYAVTNNANGLWKLTNTHVEPLKLAIVHSDGTATCKRCMFVNNDFYPLPGFTPDLFSNVNLITEVLFANNQFLNGVFNFPNSEMHSVLFTNNLSYGPMTVRGSGDLQIANHRVADGGSLNLTGGPWSPLTLSNIVVGSAGTRTGDPAKDTKTLSGDTALGIVQGSSIPSMLWTPQLTFGGASVGMTQSSSAGSWVRNPDGTRSARFTIALSAKGSSVGNAAIAAPFACQVSGFGAYQMNMMSAVNMTGVTGIPAVGAAAGGNNIILMHNNNAAFLTNANFQDNSTIAGIVTCPP